MKFSFSKTYNKGAKEARKVTKSSNDTPEFFKVLERIRNKPKSIVKSSDKVTLKPELVMDTDIAKLKQLIHTSCRSEYTLMLNEPNVTHPFRKTLTYI